MYDTLSGELVNEEFGRCDRELACGYQHLPNSNTENHHFQVNSEIKPSNKPFSVIPKKFYQESMAQFQNNNLFQFLSETFEQDHVVKVVHKYHMGSNPFNPIQTVFWQVDQDSKIRTGEIIEYQKNGKRNRNKNPYWMHKLLIKHNHLTQFELRQCAYGIDQIGGKNIAIVEGAKTAIIASLKLPDNTWIGTQGVHGLNKDLIKLLDPKKTILVPDCGYEKIWKQKAQGLYQIFSLNKLTDEGGDIADILLEYRSENKPNIPSTQ
jgi:hypothetical protein